MATNPISGIAANVIPPNAPTQSLSVARIFSRLSRAELEAFVEIAIDLANALDAPTDPDEPDFSSPSDSFPGLIEDAEPEADYEVGAFAEWDTQPQASRESGVSLIISCGHEDDEEDDPSGQCDEDGVNTTPGTIYNNGRALHGPGCPISDPGGID